MQLFDNSKSIIENLYFLSGPVLAFLGLAAIMQLRLTKKAIVTSSKREAARLSAKQIDHYNNQIIPLLDDLFRIRLKEKIEDVVIEVGDFNREAVESKLGKEETKKIIVARIKLIIPVLRVINSMEAFSTYFTKGVADEEIAYSAVGRTFCNSIEGLYFDIATCLKKDEDSSFQNIIRLYQIWSARLKKEKLYKDKEKILNQITTIGEDKKVDPIGTK